jgi:LPS sulfotransferase NodH
MSIQFVILGAPRTGSTLLVRTLNSLDDVLCHGELLGPDKVRGYEDGFDLVAASPDERKGREQRLLLEREQSPLGFIKHALAGAHAATGLKVIYSQFLTPSWSDVVEYLLTTPDTRFIHLTRLNMLRRYVSEKTAQAGGPIHSGAGGRSEVPMKIQVDIDAFLQRSKELEAQASHLASLLSGRQVLEITYEELAADTPATIERIGQFLELTITRANVEPALEKVGAADLSNAVSNYQELLDTPATRALALAD